MKFTKRNVLAAVMIIILMLEFFAGYFVVFPKQLGPFLDNIGLENRYSFLLPGHSQQNLAAPPDIKLRVGEKIPAVKIDRIFFMPYTAPHLDSDQKEIVTIEVSQNHKETYLVGTQTGKSQVYYNLYNVMSGISSNKGFTVTVVAP
jgi:hypothetical protein